MKADGCVAGRSPAVFREISVPEPGSGQLLVKVGRASTCHWTFTLWTGGSNPRTGASSSPPSFSTRLTASAPARVAAVPAVKVCSVKDAVYATLRRLESDAVRF